MYYIDVLLVQSGKLTGMPITFWSCAAMLLGRRRFGVESSRGYRPRQTTAGELAINWYTILNITFLPLRTFLIYPMSMQSIDVAARVTPIRLIRQCPTPGVLRDEIGNNCVSR